MNRKNDSCGMQIQAYSGYMKDTNILRKVASGGAASILYEMIIKEHGVVFGVKYSEDYKSAEYGIAYTLDELEQFRNSKYIEPQKQIEFEGELQSVYKVAGTLLIRGKTVLFIGMGCDIGALYGYCKHNEIDTDNLYAVDLICQGPSAPEVQKSYIEQLEKKYKSRVTYFCTRYKKVGWVPPFIHVEFENNKVFEELWETSELCYVFGQYSQKKCSKCLFKGDNHIADITLGDYWGMTADMEGYNSYGVSVLLARTAKGDELIKKIDEEEFHIQKADLEHILKHNAMYYESRQQSVMSNQFINNLNKKNLHYAVYKDIGFLRYFVFKLRRIQRTIRLL